MENIGEVIQRISIFFPAFLIALVFHEFAHAWMASRYGDETAAWRGRLTLNPLAHMDPLGTVVFPLISIGMSSGIFFGWAKPVPIDPRNFRDYRGGLFWVAFAGPLSNIVLGFASAVVYALFRKYVPVDFSLHEALSSMLEVLVVINFALAVFNLIPIPPLDGSNMVLSFLNYENTRRFLAFQQYSFFLLLFLMMTGALSVVRYPIMILTNLALTVAAAITGLT